MFVVKKEINVPSLWYVVFTIVWTTVFLVLFEKTRLIKHFGELSIYGDARTTTIFDVQHEKLKE